MAHVESEERLYLINDVWVECRRFNNADQLMHWCIGDLEKAFGLHPGQFAIMDNDEACSLIDKAEKCPYKIRLILHYDNGKPKGHRLFYRVEDEALFNLKNSKL